jgi:hypothetical protein
MYTHPLPPLANVTLIIPSDGAVCTFSSDICTACPKFVFGWVAVIFDIAIRISAIMAF